MPAKLVVTEHAGASRIALVGSSGKTLLVSAAFTEPRAKGATLRALRGLLGEGFPVEDETLAARRAKAGVANGVVGEVVALKSKALRRGRSAVTAAENAIESVVDGVANSASKATASASSATAKRSRAIAKAARPVKATSKTTVTPARTIKSAAKKTAAKKTEAKKAQARAARRGSGGA